MALQTSIAKHLAQKSLQKQGGGPDELSRPAETVSKPTASVTPTIKQERPNTPSPTPSSNNSLCPNSSSGQNKASTEQRAQTLINGVLASPQENILNGPYSEAKTNGPISLLNHGPCTPNGDFEVLKVTDLYKRSLSSSSSDLNNKGRSETGASSSGAQNIVKLTVPCGGEKAGGATSQQQGPSKNIVISTVNKGNSTVVTKVVTSTAPPTRTGTACATSAGASSNPTSILSPRIATGSGIKMATPGTGKFTVVSGSGVNSTSKVITVTTGGQGSSFICFEIIFYSNIFTFYYRVSSIIYFEIIFYWHL